MPNSTTLPYYYCMLESVVISSTSSSIPDISLPPESYQKRATPIILSVCLAPARVYIFAEFSSLLHLSSVLYGVPTFLTSRCGGIPYWRARENSNPHLELRRLLSYPLDDVPILVEVEGFEPSIVPHRGPGLQPGSFSQTRTHLHLIDQYY